MFEPIKIVGIIEERVGVPRNDGSKGSALYAVPFRLSRRPPHEWAELLAEEWNHPSRGYTSMHRPGIASVYDGAIVLDGTTLEEVESDHKEVLLRSVEVANERYVQLLVQQRGMRQAEEDRVSEHERHVGEAVKRIRFD